MSKKALPYQSWQRTLYGHLALARISNSPTVVSDTLAGAALTGTLSFNGTIVMVAVAMVLFYTAGMYLNDLLDYEIDSRERPERPLPSGAVSRPMATAGVIILFGCGSLLLWNVGMRPFLSGLVLIALIIGYDYWHKSNPLSPLLMALCRGMVYVTAFLSFPTTSPFNWFFPVCLLILYISGLTYIAKIENRVSVVSVALLAILFLPAAYFVALPTLFSFALAVLFTAWVGYSVSFTYRAQKQQVGRTVGQLIAGIALLDALVIATSRSLPGVVLALVAFGLTIYLQRYVKGT